MKRKDSFLTKKVIDDYIIVPFGSRVVDLNGLISINETAFFLWNHLANECTIEELIASLEQQYDVEHDQAVYDVNTFLTQLKSLDMLDIDE